MKIKRNPNLTTVSRHFKELGNDAHALASKFDTLNQMVNNKEFNVTEIEAPIEAVVEQIESHFHQIRELMRSM